MTSKKNSGGFREIFFEPLSCYVKSVHLINVLQPHPMMFDFVIALISKFSLNESIIESAFKVQPQFDLFIVFHLRRIYVVQF